MITTKKKIFICGDSFSCIDKRYPGAHWSEKLQCLLGETYQIINLARPGASNFLIYLQVIRAAESNASFVIVNATEPGRIELRKILENTSLIDSINDRIARSGEYKQDQVLDDRLTPLSDGSFFSFSVQSFVNDSIGLPWQKMTKGRAESLKRYLADVFDFELAAYQDAAYLIAASSILRDSNIQFSWHPGLWSWRGAKFELLRKAVKVTEFVDINLPGFAFDNKYTFHTSNAKDIEYIANAYYKLLKEKMSDDNC